MFAMRKARSLMEKRERDPDRSAERSETASPVEGNVGRGKQGSDALGNPGTAPVVAKVRGVARKKTRRRFTPRYKLNISASGRPSQPPLAEDEFRAMAETVVRQPDRADVAHSANTANSATGLEVNWKPPIPFAPRNLPLFPAHVFPPWLLDYVTELSSATQTPCDLSAMVVLSALATTSAKIFEVEIKPGYVEPLNIYTMTVLPTANRKSVVFKEVTAALEEVEEQEALRLQAQVTETETRIRIAERRLKKAQDAAANAEPDDRLPLERYAVQCAQDLAGIRIQLPPRLIADDVTPERLATLLLNNHGRIAILSAEGDIFNVMAGRHSRGQPNFVIFLKGHSGDDHRVDRVGRPSEHIKSPALTMGLTTQPDVLRSFMDRPDFLGRGLPARFLYSIPVSRVGHRDLDAPSVSLQTRETYRQHMLALLALTTNAADGGNIAPVTLQLDPAALTIWREFAATLEPRLGELGDLAHISDWGGKLPGAVARLAGLLHVAEHQREGRHHPIAGDIFERATEIGHYLIPHALAAYEMTAGLPSAQAKIVWNWIVGKELSTFSLRDAFEALKGRFKKVDNLRPPIDLLVEHRYIRQKALIHRDGPGRKRSPIYEVNPLARTCASQNSQNAQNPETGPLSGVTNSPEFEEVL
jgi:replicative DNA helicase